MNMEGEIQWEGKGNVAEETITPEWVLKQIKTYEGYGANKIMEVKELKASDLDTNQGRLSLTKQVDRNFLNIGELGILAAVPKKGVKCLFIDTNGKDHGLELRNWANGLVLTKGWSDVIKKEAFEIGQKYPLWCFRSRNKNDKLCFTLVKPDEVDPIEVLANVDNKDAKLSDTEVEEVANKNDTESSSFSSYAQEKVNHASGAAALKLAEVEKNLELVKEAVAVRDRMIELAEQAKLNLLLAEELHEACSQGKIVELKLSETEVEKVANKNDTAPSSFKHPAASPDGYSSLPGHGQVMNVSKDVLSVAECKDLAVNEPESESFQDVLPNVDNKDAKLSETEVEEVANKNDTESSSFSHGHLPESPAGVNSLPGEDMDLSYLDDGYYFPTKAEVKSFHDDLFP